MAVNLKVIADGFVRAFEWAAKAVDDLAESLKRFVILEEVRAWVDYDRAVAPYGYWRKGLHRWEREQGR